MKTSRAKVEAAPSQDMRWIISNFKKLRQDRRDKWIAVRNSTVILSDDELEPLLNTLKEKFGSSHGITVEFIGGKPRNLLL